ncbi:MAG TPA: hypothetical protein VNE16_15220 [Vicinamibacterales bacterium]|nr:hypothetical protein [Vicinamibacterales bacterium]
MTPLPAGTPSRPSIVRRRLLLSSLCAAVFAATFAIRVHGISHHFWLLGDQIRDWGIALRPFRDLPLVGPPTHVGGYTIGPAFYWILWLLRVVFGPWFHDLPHAGGIGQAALQSGADVLLLVAIRKRTGSTWLALAAIVILATAPFALSLAAVIWNPIVGSILAETATALVLLDWPRRSLVRSGIVAAIAWCAVHAYTGAVFVALGIFAALLVQPFADGARRSLWKHAAVIGGVVVLLQVPYLVHQARAGSTPGGMSAVTDSMARVLSGSAQTRFHASADTYADAVNGIEAAPWSVPACGWLLIVCGLLVAARYRRDPALLAVILLPQVLAIAGFGFWLAGLDSYYYLSLMPAAVLTVLLGIRALLPRRAADAVAIVLCAAALVLAVPRVRAGHMFDMPQYAALVKGSSAIVSMGQPMRSVQTAFPLPPTADPTFIFRILGGRFDQKSPWAAVIQPDGRVTYTRDGAPVR